MLQTFKAPLVPTVILIGEIVALKWAPEWFVSGLVGFALFWLFGSLLGNKAISRRFSWLCEWLPFLDPSGFATPVELLNTHIQGKTFRLLDVAIDGEVTNRTFDDCIIYGPAVIAPTEINVMRDPTWKPRHGDIWHQIDDIKVRAGMVVLENCTLNRCTLIDIGVAGDNREEFFKGITTTVNPQSS